MQTMGLDVEAPKHSLVCPRVGGCTHLGVHLSILNCTPMGSGGMQLCTNQRFVQLLWGRPKEGPNGALKDLSEKLRTISPQIKGAPHHSTLTLEGGCT